jgi:hypothetical protein
MDAANASGSQERVVIHFSSLNLYGFHNSTLPLSILASGAEFIGQRGTLLIACDLLPMRGEFLSGGELRRQDAYAKASGEGVEIGSGHAAERDAEFSGFVFADFASLRLTVGELVQRQAYDVVRGDVAGGVIEHFSVDHISGVFCV